MGPGSFTFAVWDLLAWALVGCGLGPCGMGPWFNHFCSAEFNCSLLIKQHRDALFCSTGVLSRSGENSGISRISLLPPLSSFLSSLVCCLLLSSSLYGQFCSLDPRIGYDACLLSPCFLTSNTLASSLLCGVSRSVFHVYSYSIHVASFSLGGREAGRGSPNAWLFLVIVYSV